MYIINNGKTLMFLIFVSFQQLTDDSEKASM